MNLRRWLAHVVLGLLLLFSQQHAAQHWLAHAIEATHAKGAPSQSHCDECDALSAFTGAMPAPAHALPVVLVTRYVATAAVELPAPEVPFVSAYRSRAPPIAA
ncbi:MAG TPA: hypothetical protein VGM81_13080 [Burkholderiaceae bacterium]